MFQCDDQWTTLRGYNTRQFNVALQYQDDEASPESMDSATLAGIRDGRYACYCFRVIVLWNGREVGSDYLSESVYEDPAAFAREHFGINPRGRVRGIEFGCYFSDMLRNAIAEARATLAHVPAMRIPKAAMRHG